MKTLLVYCCFCVMFFMSFTSLAQSKAQNIDSNAAIAKTLDLWHEAAAKADFEAYFGLMTADAVFIGTDATEHWGLNAFKAFSKPYFDAGKAWDFTAIDRHIFVYENHKLAWFDELLDTHMGVCRGSGVMTQVNGSWKVMHYVLSMTVPNSKMQEVVKVKQANDQSIIANLKQ